MDTSKKYIKMCERAKEIQKSCGKDSIGYKPVFTGITYDGNDVFYVKENKLIIWLPRLNRLLRMANIHKCWGLTHNSGKWSTWTIGSQIFLESESPEKALLKRVMYEIHKKIWDDKKEEWIIK